MTSGWLQNTEAKERVINLLEHAGIPLELQVATICNKFCSSMPPESIYANSSQWVYSTPENPNEVREIDQVVELASSSITSTETCRIEVSVKLPIECKYRKNSEYFAFPSGNTYLHMRFPAYALGLRFLPGCEDILQSYKNMFNVPKTALTTLKIEDGQKPVGVHEENLIYNATGALYDFISFDLQQEHFAITELREKAEKTIEALTLLPMVGKEDWNWNIVKGEEAVVRELIQKIVSPKMATVFNDHLRNQLTKFDPMVLASEEIKLYIPIVCVNGPIYYADWVSEPEDKDFYEIEYALTSIRRRNWPDKKVRMGMEYRHPEVPVIVTNPAHLEKVLETVSTWLQDMDKILNQIINEHEDNLPLEIYLCRKILSIFQAYEKPDNLWRG